MSDRVNSSIGSIQALNRGLRFVCPIILSALVFVSCSEKRTAIEKTGHTRIVSLSPSITKQVIDLGAGDLIVGITSYCPSPNAAASVVGSITTPNLEAIIRLRPDLILLSEEDSIVQRSESLSIEGARVHKFGRNSGFESMLENYRTLSAMLKKEKEGADKISSYRSERDSLRSIGKNKKAAFFISHRPLICSSGSSYIHGILTDAGALNIFSDLTMPYPIVSVERLVKSNPDVIISMDKGPEKFFTEYLAGLNMNAVSNKKIFYVNPDHVSSYAPADYIEALKEIKSIMSSL